MTRARGLGGEGWGKWLSKAHDLHHILPVSLHCLGIATWFQAIQWNPWTRMLTFVFNYHTLVHAYPHPPPPPCPAPPPPPRGGDRHLAHEQ